MKGAIKERSYLEEFGQPLLPFERMRREAYQYQKQSPLDHIQNLDRYLLLAPSLIPKNTNLSQFRIRHPDLQPGNIIVDSGFNIVGLIDWQHTSVLPHFVYAGIPKWLQNYDDLVSQSDTQPSLPENLVNLTESQQSRERERYRRRLVHHLYVQNSKEYNKLHYMALTDPLNMLRLRLFSSASDTWEGETLALKVALIDVTENWERLTEGGPPCPVAFDAEDVRETKKLDAEVTEMDESQDMSTIFLGCGDDGWVPNEHYEAANTLNKQLKDGTLTQAESEKEWTEVMDHWHFDDMAEKQYS